ncbi:MAG: thioredoxin [Candidatus Delongbacteria bacterium]|nr:thioredoxin [Candidatus Delongbacteria bacterium]
MTTVFSDQDFQDKVLNSDKPVLVDFWAPWCGPCQILGPMIDMIAGEVDDNVIIGKMNVDENPSTPQRYGIQGIPTIIIFKEGKEFKRLVGLQHKDNYVQALKEANN